MADTAMELKYKYMPHDLEDVREILDADVDVDRRISKVIERLIEVTFRLEHSTSSTKSVPFTSWPEYDDSAAS